MYKRQLLKREIEKDVLPYCIEHDMGVLSYGSIGAGALTGKFKERPTFEDGDKRGEFYEFFNEQNWPKTKAMIDTLEEIASCLLYTSRGAGEIRCAGLGLRAVPAKYPSAWPWR